MKYIQHNTTHNKKKDHNTERHNTIKQYEWNKMNEAPPRRTTLATEKGKRTKENY